MLPHQTESIKIPAVHEYISTPVSVVRRINDLIDEHGNSRTSNLSLLGLVQVITFYLLENGLPWFTPISRAKINAIAYSTGRTLSLAEQVQVLKKTDRGHLQLAEDFSALTAAQKAAYLAKWKKRKDRNKTAITVEEIDAYFAAIAAGVEPGSYIRQDNDPAAVTMDTTGREQLATFLATAQHNQTDNSTPDQAFMEPAFSDWQSASAEHYHPQTVTPGLGYCCTGVASVLQTETSDQGKQAPLNKKKNIGEGEKALGYGNGVTVVTEPAPQNFSIEKMKEAANADLEYCTTTKQIADLVYELVEADRYLSKHHSDSKCDDHTGTDSDTPCRACGEIRKLREAVEKKLTAAVAKARRLAINNCHDCDPNGWRPGIDGLVKCKHPMNPLPPFLQELIENRQQRRVA